MEALGNFLKTALYRVIFVLIVGIPAVELLALTFFDNGIIIQKIDNETLTGKVKITFDKFALKPWNSIPGTINVQNQENSANESSLFVEIPNADIRVYSDPQMEIKNNNIIQLGNFKFTFRDLSTAGWLFYLTIAWILGEIFCFLGETLIGCIFFDYKPFNLENVEKVSPQYNDNANDNAYITSTDFIKASQNATVMEISEIHFVLSRVFSGLVFVVLLLLALIFKWIGLPIIISIIIIFIIIFICIKICGGEVVEKIKCLLCCVFTIPILYRAHANRLLKAAAQNNREGQGVDRRG